MSEFANFIRVAIQGLPENTPAARAAAYDRARKAIKRQLESRGAGEAETREALDNVENAILDIEAEQSFAMPMPAQSAQPAPPPMAPPAAPKSPIITDAKVTPISRRPEPPARPAAPVVPQAPAAPMPSPAAAVGPSSFGMASSQALRAETQDDPLAAFESALSAELAAPMPEREIDEDAVADALEKTAASIKAHTVAANTAKSIDIRGLLNKAIAKDDMTDPATREIIYRRARTALGRYLRTLQPPPDYETVHSCIEKLNEAIRKTEVEWAAEAVSRREVDISFDTDDLMRDLGEDLELDLDFDNPPADTRTTSGDQIAAEVEEALKDFMFDDEPPAKPAGRLAAPKPAAAKRPAPQPAPRQEVNDRWIPEIDDPVPSSSAGASAPSRSTWMAPPPAYAAEPERRRKGGWLLLILVILIAIGGGAAAVTMPEQTSKVVDRAFSMAMSLISKVKETGTATPESAKPASAEAPKAAEAAKAAETQQPAAPIAETKNVTPPPAVAESTPSPEPQPQPAAAPARGEKAFLFQTSGTERKPASQGNVSWSVVDVSSGSGANPADTAIRADLSVPGDGLTAAITLKRNLDASLPATHLIEMVFALTDAFTGGSIDNVEGVSFLQSSRGASEPLAGSTVKIADGVFIFALSDVPDAVARNVSILSKPDMIEIPLVYSNGERATLRLVSGSSGERAFTQALAAWGTPAAAAAAPAPQAAAPAPSELQPAPAEASTPLPMSAPAQTAPAVAETPAEPDAATAEAPAETAVVQVKPVLPVVGPIPADRPGPF